MRISDWSSDVCSSDLCRTNGDFMLLDILQHPTVIIGRDRERNLGEGAAVLQVGGKGRFNLLIRRLIFTVVLGRGAIASNGADNRLRLSAFPRRPPFTFKTPLRLVRLLCPCICLPTQP